MTLLRRILKRKGGGINRMLFCTLRNAFKNRYIYVCYTFFRCRDRAKEIGPRMLLLQLQQPYYMHINSREMRTGDVP